MSSLSHGGRVVALGRYKGEIHSLIEGVFSGFQLNLLLLFWYRFWVVDSILYF